MQTHNSDNNKTMFQTDQIRATRGSLDDFLERGTNNVANETSTQKMPTQIAFSMEDVESNRARGDLNTNATNIATTFLSCLNSPETWASARQFF